MTTLTLSGTTQSLIDYAFDNGPGTDNVNYINAYNAIYSDLVGNGSIDPGVLYWFSQAANVNGQQYSSTATGTFIWNYTEAAAASEGQTITDTDMQNASNAIALKVITTLRDSSYSFSDAGNFSPTNIVSYDAGAGISYLQSEYPMAGFTNAIWGGTPFARLALGNPTYFTDQSIDLTAGSRDSNAILSGSLAGSIAVLTGGYTGSVIANMGNVDFQALELTALSPNVAALVPSISNSILPLSEIAALVSSITKAFNTVNHLISAGATSTEVNNFVTNAGQVLSNIISGMSGFFGEMTSASNSWWGVTFGAPKTGSPIILDLDGDGVTTLSKDAGVYFNLRNTSGFAEQTGWAGPNDGLLVWDRDSSGTIDNGGELFGNYTLESDNSTVAPNGFAALASYDDNSDGVIDSSDAIWSDLQVWVDSNSNGITDPGELHSLSSLGIQSLNLSYTNAGDVVTDSAGNHPEYVGSYTKTDTTTAAMTDVFFADDTSQTIPTTWATTTPTIDALPDLSEMGTMPSLHQAMALDMSGDIEDLVSDFTTNTNISDREDDVENILIDWAGAQGVDPTSRNANSGDFNAQHLTVLEAAMGRPYVQWDWGSNAGDPGPLTAPQLENDYFFLFERTYAELAAQTFLKSYYDEITTTTSGGVTQFDFSAALTDLFSTGTDDDITEFYRTVFASGIPDAQVNYGGLLTSLATNRSDLVGAVDTIVAPYYAYDLMPNIVGAEGWYDIYAATDGSTIVGGLGGSTIYANEDPYGAGSDNIANTTVYGNAGTNDIWAEANGVDRLYGGTGDDTIHDQGTLAVGTVIDGGAGDNTLDMFGTANISQATVTNMQSLIVNNALTLTAEQFDEFTNVTGNAVSNVIYATDTGIYSLADKTASGTITLNAVNTAEDVTLIGNDQNGQYLIGGSGNDTLTGGDGNYDTFEAGSGTTTITAGDGIGDTLQSGNGAATLVGGSGGDYFYSGNAVVTMEGGTGEDTFSPGYNLSGTTITGGGGTDTLVAPATGNITNLSISDVQILQGNYVTLTNDEFEEFSNITGSGILYVTDAGTYDLSTKTVSGSYNLNAGGTSADVTLIGNNQNFQTLLGGSGTDTLQGGNGIDDLLEAGSGTTTMIAGSGNTELDGGAGYDAYTFGSSFGNDVIYSGSSTRNGEIDFSGASSQQLWLQQSGSDLKIDLLGTSDVVTVSGWFGSSAAQVNDINGTDGYLANSQVASLVSAMATYATNNPGFNPATAGMMPTDTTLQSAIAAAWHA